MRTLTTTLLCLVLAGTAFGQRTVDRVTKSPTIEHCLVSLVDEVQLPAEDQGVLATVDVQEGDRVTKGQVVARIDDTQAQKQRQAAEIEYREAKSQAENDVIIRAAIASAGVARAEYDKALEANRREPGAIPEIEVRRLHLTHERSVLQIEQAELDFATAGSTAEVKATALALAHDGIKRRQLDSPIAGQVVRIYRHAGEWSQPGEPVMHIVRMDKLRVEGFLNANEYSALEVRDRPVTIHVHLERKRTERFEGTVKFVSPMVEANGQYRIWAELENKPIGQHWLVQPGMTATMTVHVLEQ